MYSYEWDQETGGILLTTDYSNKFSKEPRPVYAEELNILGFNKYFKYENDNTYPYMWAESSNYFYRGKLIAKTKGGSVYTEPDLVVLDEAEPNGGSLCFVDIPKMVEKNRDLVEKIASDTKKKIYNTYISYKSKVDIFYVAFSGGKDSIVALSLVKQVLPHNAFMVLFGDTGMENEDTYNEIEIVERECKEDRIDFFRSKSNMDIESSWALFGPPAVTIRWCCSVHKTTPQILFLRNYLGNPQFRGMAFTGIRGSESQARSEYTDISFGKKVKGQYSFHPILDWNSAELFSYIYQENLRLNKAYKRGNSRVGCLVCPMSSGKHEYMKAQCYPEDTKKFLERIKETSNKSFSKKEMDSFIDNGFWKKRKSGRELNFGLDKHIFTVKDGKLQIIVKELNSTWKEWAKTIGQLIELSEYEYTIIFKEKFYSVHLEKMEDRIFFSFPNCGSSKEDTKFIALFRSVIIKSLYCINCGVCAANCSSNCIDMSNGLVISNNCIHCYQCHDIYAHCLRYNSIRNVENEEDKMGIDRYFSIGIKKEWIDLFFRAQGSTEFWESDGNGFVANKKKDAFLCFVKDANLVTYNREKDGDKYSKHEPTRIAKILFQLGSDSDSTWALMLSNLVYTPEFNWFIKNIPFYESITPEQFRVKLEPSMPNDIKGLGKRNVISAFKFLLTSTPFGNNLGLGKCDYEKKNSSMQGEAIKLNSFSREEWKTPDPLVILYSLYLFAEKCCGYYQFTLSRLLNHSVDSGGISPTEIFGLDREKMKNILSGLSVNYPDYIKTSFTLDLDNIILNQDKQSEDILDLFVR